MSPLGDRQRKHLESVVERARRTRERKRTLHAGSDLPGTASAAPARVQMIVKSIEQNTLVCRTFDSDTQEEGDEPIVVAKPEELRRSTHHNQTVEIAGQEVSYVVATGEAQSRTASVSTEFGSVSESHRVFPPYRVDGLIYADPVEHMEFGIWLDANVDARRWLEVQGGQVE